MKNTALIITSIAKQNHPVLKQYALNAKKMILNLLLLETPKVQKTLN
jgi:hypothetical protein